MRKTESTSLALGVIIIGFVIIGFLIWWRYFAENPGSYATIVEYADLKIDDKFELDNGSGFQLLAVDSKNQAAKLKVWQNEDIREIVITKKELVIPGYVLFDIREDKIQIIHLTAGSGHGRPFGDLLRVLFPNF